MSGIQYLKNQILPVLVNLMGMLALSLFLLANGNPVQTVGFMVIVWLMVLITYLSIVYELRKKYLNRLLEMAEQLDERERYLMPEI